MVAIRETLARQMYEHSGQVYTKLESVRASLFEASRGMVQATEIVDPLPAEPEAEPDADPDATAEDVTQPPSPDGTEAPGIGPPLAAPTPTIEWGPAKVPAFLDSGDNSVHTKTAQAADTPLNASIHRGYLDEADAFVEVAAAYPVYHEGEDAAALVQASKDRWSTAVATLKSQYE